MTSILTIIQDASMEIGIEKPSGIFGTDDRTKNELARIANKAVRALMRAHDWQVLMKPATTAAGDGSTEEFDLPSDYDRMMQGAKLWASDTELPLSRIKNEDQWLHFEVSNFDLVTKSWIIFGGKLNIKPAPATGVTVRYFYVSKNICTDSGGTPKEHFTADTDLFRLDPELMRLAFIYEWKKEKEQPFVAAMADLEEAKAKAVMHDKGSREIRVGRPRFPVDANLSYPKSIAG